MVIGTQMLGCENRTFLLTPNMQSRNESATPIVVRMVTNGSICPGHFKRISRCGLKYYIYLDLKPGDAVAMPMENNVRMRE